MSETEILIKATKRLSNLVLVFILCVLLSVLLHFGLSEGWFQFSGGTKGVSRVPIVEATYWEPPDSSSINDSEDSSLIRYGKDLVEHTSRYLGPKGTVNAITNGMDCSNCHLLGGTKVFAANFSAVASTYPKYRDRSGTLEGFEKRINDCLQRSLNGSAIEDDSREMKAMIAYIKWLGKDVAKGEIPLGAGLQKLPFLGRSADTLRGRNLYTEYCSSCHRLDGAGEMADNQLEWKYPPLWGDSSYNTGAGLFRVSRLASFLKVNMPFGVTHTNPLLTDEQAWDIAAYVNSKPRPHKEFPGDWPDISKKPVDHPFGPYADSFSELQHKYGPFGPMAKNNRK